MTEQLLNNRYRVIMALSAGGFGETFLVEDTQMPSERRCVVKQLKPITTNPQIYQLVQERFQREAAILERLGDGSDRIPRLYAYFSTAGQFYLVQEWIDGKTLTQKVRQHGLFSEKSVQDILINLLPVLDYVHSHGIIHRDIKPDNIIVRHRDAMPVLIDFGAVKETMGTVIDPQGNSTSSIIIGTPGFMPSEQAAGRPLYSSDLYSLGLTAIFLLSGRRPQDLEMNPDTGDLLWHQYVSSVNPNLAAVLDKAVQSHPRDRYPTARAMLDALLSPTTPTSLPLPSPEQTVALSPQPTQINIPPAGERRRFAPILLGSLFAGGLIGITAIAALFLNNKPSSSQLDQVIPTYSPAAFSPTDAFEPCPNDTQLYNIGETKHFRFIICGKNRQHNYYIGMDKSDGSRIKITLSGDEFRNGEYIYKPPSYEDTNYADASVRVYQGDKEIVNEKIIQMYKLPQN